MVDEDTDWELLSDTATTDEEYSTKDSNQHIDTTTFMSNTGKQYKCDICNVYSTIYKCNLQRHKRKHSGERPYVCPVCQKAFTTKANCQRHQRIHGDGKTFKCTVCNKSFTSKENCTRHERSSHKADNDAERNIPLKPSLQGTKTITADKQSCKSAIKEKSGLTCNSEDISYDLLREEITKQVRNSLCTIYKSKPNESTVHDRKQPKEVINDNIQPKNKQLQKINGKESIPLCDNQNEYRIISCSSLSESSETYTEAKKLKNKKKHKQKNDKIFVSSDTVSAKEQHNCNTADFFNDNEIEDDLPLLVRLKKRKSLEANHTTCAEQLKNNLIGRHHCSEASRSFDLDESRHAVNQKHMKILEDEDKFETNKKRSLFPVDGGPIKCKRRKLSDSNVLIPIKINLNTSGKVFKNAGDLQKPMETKTVGYKMGSCSSSKSFEEVESSEESCSTICTGKDTESPIEDNKINDDKNNTKNDEFSLTENESSGYPTSNRPKKKEEQSSMNYEHSISTVEKNIVMPSLENNLPAKTYQSTISNTFITESDLRYLFRKILKWNPVWLEEHEKVKKTPPDIAQTNKNYRMKKVYTSKEEYFKILIPHLLLETWETCLQSWKIYHQNRVCIDCAFKEKEKSKDGLFLFVKVTAFRMEQEFKRGALVIVTTTNDENSHSELGYVEDALIDDQNSKCELLIRVRPSRTSVSSEIFGKTSLTFLVSLNEILSFHSAMINLFETTLSRYILNPGEDHKVFHNLSSVNYAIIPHMDRFNNIQNGLIYEGARTALELIPAPRIGLIWGGSGTGKTYTLSGIVNEVFERDNGKCKICVCAPSNNAVQVLLKGILRERGCREDQSNSSELRIVVVGEISRSLYPHLYKYSLTSLVKKELKREKYTKVRDLSARINELRSKMCYLKQEYKERIRSEEKLTIDISKLASIIDGLEKQNMVLLNSIKEDLKRELLMKSHVVCGTFKSFGDQFLLNTLSCKENKSRKSRFSCLIMDEAQQATEIESLIPLQYGTNKVIICGDLDQLQPNVRSKESLENGFTQSLFKRFVKHFLYDENNPITVLRTQYRMNNVIAQISGNKNIKTHSYVANRFKKFNLKPFILFNLKSSDTETRANTTDVDFTILLCEFLNNYLSMTTHLRQSDIGVISTSDQGPQIKDGLISRKLNKIEVGTVSSYQGHEKEIIIITAPHREDESLDDKELNVALTRARTALYVVGCLDILKDKDSVWGSFIEEARFRDDIYHINQGTVLQTAFNYCISISDCS